MSTRHHEQGPLARRLSHLRWSACLSRSELAERAGISRHLVQSLEQGRIANPKLRTLLSLARALNVGFPEMLLDVHEENCN